MNKKLLEEHVKQYVADLQKNAVTHLEDLAQRKERVAIFKGWTKERLRALDSDQLYEYLAPLWAMLIWGNKRYVTDKLIEDNGIDSLRAELANLIWGSAAIEERWDQFRAKIKGVGPAMMSELLCHTHPDKYPIWNRRAYVGLNYLGVKNLPRHNYQMTGKRYISLAEHMKDIQGALNAAGVVEVDLLTVDYFIWDELQVENELSQVFKKPAADEVAEDAENDKVASFIHDEVRDKLKDIGTWLGLSSKIEVKVADGSKGDTIWESTIGNMGRVIYVFEVQTKGSIDSLIINLLKSLNNPAVQGVVAVSDAAQISKIKKHSALVPGLAGKLRFWDYTEVLEIHEALSLVNEKINLLNLVPQGF